jgi:hypothetical protein
MNTNTTQTLTRKQRKALERANKQAQHAAQQKPTIKPDSLRSHFIVYCNDHQDASLTLALKALDNHNHAKTEKDRDYWAEEAAYWSWYSDQAKDWRLWAENATDKSFNAWMQWIGLPSTAFYNYRSHEWYKGN